MWTPSSLKSKDDLIEYILDLEGRYITDDPSDRGGLTCCGISKVHNPQWAGWDILEKYKGSLRRVAISDIPGEIAVPLMDAVHTFYKKKLSELKLDTLPIKLVAEIYEQSTVIGIRRTTEYIQRVLNALNDPKYNLPDLTVDGAYGPKTRERLTLFCDKYGLEEAIRIGINALQVAHFISIGEKNPSQRIYTKGWIIRRGQI